MLLNREIEQKFFFAKNMQQQTFKHFANVHDIEQILFMLQDTNNGNIYKYTYLYNRN